MTTNERATPPATRRVDAQRNRDKILAAARAAFADPDADVSMADIARRANIGSATLYRNFADRRTLLEALYSEEIATICQAAQTCEGATPGARLQAWLRRFYGYFLHKRVLASELLHLTDAESPVFREGFALVLDAAESLVQEAHRSGELRNDLDATQILALIASIASIPGEPVFRTPILTAALDALWTPNAAR
ncbi:TetR/AcrR family transcriptional regulator [Mycolicibacterium aubagnense]|uniref:TetR family transcriptional regulator n=1 Tax=Mycolicibacterium aubagnense TaxID=319707 RepID=A0ABM7IJ76_9MYCO|nr:TetR/AcrR family transcriptional regulator [Mycolicibacterium aubagnense]TLH66741.1 TetR family transcriptional regulator [Mycolicibacterium aubagnense]WGI31670.1 TetR/AcrR family transcriptional regulator [Mycolicibacterium aubagnense]BBX86850.1 TetR family transcriptional regulator [Mycolicibacterium aubagnense]